jgi:hypothetical protein
MPLIKLHRINKGGEMFIHSEQIRFIEKEAGSTTINMGPGNVYSVEETGDQISALIEEMEMLRIRNAILSSGLAGNRE